MRVLEWLWSAGNALKREKERSAALHEQLHKSNEMLMECAEAATLVSINRNGRQIVLTFIRNGEIYRMHCYAAIDFNIAQWQRLLVDKELQS